MPGRVSRAAALASLMVLASGSAATAQESIRGLVRAVHDAWISTELNAEIIEVTRREGEAFKRNDVLVRFDCDKYQSDLDAARAELQMNKVVLDNSVELDRRRAIGRFEVAQNRAKYDKAKAQAETIAVKVRQCVIRAPFDGRLAELKARAFELSNPSQPLMRLVNADDLEIELIVPSTWLTWLAPGSSFKVRVDETGTTLLTHVRRIAPMVDSVSQTVKIVAGFAETATGVLPGMSLSADLRKPAL